MVISALCRPIFFAVNSLIPVEFLTNLMVGGMSMPYHGFHQWVNGGTQNRWFILESPLKLDENSGYPHDSGNLHLGPAITQPVDDLCSRTGSLISLRSERIEMCTTTVATSSLPDIQTSSTGTPIENPESMEI